MKKIIVSLFLLTACLLTSACGSKAVPSEMAGSSVESNSSVDSKNSTESDSENTDLNNAVDTFSMMCEKVDFDDTAIERLDTSPLYFTEILGTRKRFENALPSIIGFEYPYVFYERMSVIVDGATEDDASMYVGRYSIDTQTIQEFPLDDFNAITDEARLIIDENRSIYMYCTPDDKGELIMKIVLFDFSNDTKHVIGTYAVHNVFGYAKKLSEDELVFLLYEAVETGTQQIVLHYDLNSDEMKEVYRGSTMTGYLDSSNSTKDIWAIDTSDGYIDLLMQQVENGKMTFYLRTIDKYGNIICDNRLNDLSMYDSVGDTVDSLTKKDGYLFIHFSQFNKDRDNTNPPSVILYQDGDEYRLVKAEDDNAVGTLCGEGSLDNPYLFFSSQETENEIYAFDTDTRREYKLSLELNDVGDVAVDSQGNMLVMNRERSESNWYLIKVNDLTKMLA